MPKILINELDRTSPGSPASYANYAVLIPGFVGEAANGGAKKDPDSNGVYEFTNSQQFLDTIGLLENARYSESREQTFEYVASATGEMAEGTATCDVFADHYGNKMAYALLELGYSVIYRPLTSLQDLTSLGDKSFWDIFRDKASYDFRFVVHGLANSTSTADYSDYSAFDIRKNCLNAADTYLVALKTDPELGDAKLDTADGMSALNNLHKQRIASMKADADNNTFRLILEGLTAEGAAEATDNYFDAVIQVGKDLAEIEAKIDMLDEAIIEDTLLNKANGAIADLAAYSEATAGSEEALDIPGRGDCTALIELDEKTYLVGNGTKKPEEAIIEGINTLQNAAGITDVNGTFCALTVPGVVYVGDKDGSMRFPGSFHYLACFMASLQKGFAEWYAAAGYTRGVSSYVVKNTTVKLGEIAINALEPRYLIQSESVTQPKFACNVIANFRGSYYLWGNRTAHPLGDYGNETNGDLTASSFLNIRQLCSTIKKQLYVSCRRFTFDPNSDVLWINFVNAIKPTLDAMKADQGIRDYKILKEATTQKATLKAKIRIIPIEAVEDFYLTVSLEDSFGTTAAVTGDIQ